MIGERLKCAACGRDVPLTDDDRDYLKTHPLAAFHCPPCIRESEREHRERKREYEAQLKAEYEAACWDAEVGPASLSVWPERNHFVWQVRVDGWTEGFTAPTRDEAIELATTAAAERFNQWAREAAEMALGAEGGAV